MIDLGSGKQIVVSCDMGRMWIQIFANQGSLGVELPEKEAMALAGAIIAGVRRNRKR